MADRKETQHMLDLACAMWDDPLVYMYQDPLLVGCGTPSIFLAGPSSREDVLEFKWRINAVQYLRLAGFKGIIYVPEPRENDWSFKDEFEGEIVEWEKSRLLSASMVLVWIPRHQTQLPGRVTNTELGVLIGMALALPAKYSDRFEFGYPSGAWKVKSETHWAIEAGKKPFYDLQAMCGHIAQKLAFLGAWSDFVAQKNT